MTLNYCFLKSTTPTLMAFTGVTNAHGPSPQPTACRSPTLQYCLLYFLLCCTLYKRLAWSCANHLSYNKKVLYRWSQLLLWWRLTLHAFQKELPLKIWQKIKSKVTPLMVVMYDFWVVNYARRTFIWMAIVHVSVHCEIYYHQVVQ